MNTSNDPITWSLDVSKMDKEMFQFKNLSDGAEFIDPCVDLVTLNPGKSYKLGVLCHKCEFHFLLNCSLQECLLVL